MPNSHPWSKFFWSDWRTDPNLCRCSKAAKGFWIDCLCLMHECDERGVLSTGGCAWSDGDIAAAVGGDHGTNMACLQELLDKGVAHRNSSGAVYSRRMVRDAEISRVRADAGSKGGSKGGSKPIANRQANRKQTLSDSDSDSDSDPVPEGGDARGGGWYNISEHRAKQIFAAYPKRVKPGRGCTAVRNALSRILAEHESGRRELPLSCYDWLLMRVRKFAAAVEDAPLRHLIPDPHNWFDNCQYDDDDEQWAFVGRASDTGSGAKEFLDA